MSYSDPIWFTAMYDVTLGIMFRQQSAAGLAVGLQSSAQAGPGSAPGLAPGPGGPGSALDSGPDLDPDPGSASRGQDTQLTHRHIYALNASAIHMLLMSSDGSTRSDLHRQEQ